MTVAKPENVIFALHNEVH